MPLVEVCAPTKMCDVEKRAIYARVYSTVWATITLHLGLTELTMRCVLVPMVMVPRTAGTISRILQDQGD